LPAAIGHRVVRDAIEAAGGTPNQRDVNRLWRLARSGADGAGVDLHGLRVDCTRRVLRIGPQRPPRERLAGFAHRLDVPGQVRIPETGAILRASLLSAPTRAVSPPAGWDDVATLPASAVAGPLLVRSRRPGDRLRPLGAPGSRRLQDLLVDRKIPRSERDVVPIVVNGAGEILWVAGVATSEVGRVREPEAGMVILEFKKGTL
jgi:tRNA(Ile)-lysidine synthase